MRFVPSHHLDRVFAAGSHIAVLRVLATATGPLSGRQAARTARFTHRSCLQALQRLENLGLVHREIGARDHLFTLNKNNVLVREGVLPLLDLEAQFTPRLARALRKECASFVDSLILHEHFAGARRTGTDVFTVYAIVSGSDERVRVAEVLAGSLPSIQRQFGVHLDAVVLLQSEFLKRARRGLLPSSTLLRDGRVIFGKTLKELGLLGHHLPIRP